LVTLSVIGEARAVMTKALVGLQDLRRKIYAKAKADASWR